VTTKLFNLADLLDWFEALLDHRSEHEGEWFVLHATDERFVEVHVTAEEIKAGGVSNYNLNQEQWLTEFECIKMNLFGWALEGLDTPEPQYVRRWAPFTPTATIVAGVLRVFTSIYLGRETDLIEVARGRFAEDNVGWENSI
jgi:hypothetical protein